MGCGYEDMSIGGCSLPLLFPLLAVHPPPLTSGGGERGEEREKREEWAGLG